MDRFIAISEIEIFQNYDFRLFVRFLNCRIFTIFTNDFVRYDERILMIRVLVLNNQKS